MYDELVPDRHSRRVTLIIVTQKGCIEKAPTEALHFQALKRTVLFFFFRLVTGVIVEHWSGQHVKLFRVLCAFLQPHSTRKV
jgi:hypothetical protein